MPFALSWPRITAAFVAGRRVEPDPANGESRSLSMKMTRIYLHLAGTVFRDEADALERRLVSRGPCRRSGAEYGRTSRNRPRADGPNSALRCRRSTPRSISSSRSRISPSVQTDVGILEACNW